MKQGKKKIAILAAASLLLGSGCSKIQQEPEVKGIPIATGTTYVTEPVATETKSLHTEVALEVPEIVQQDAEILLEAEDSAIPEGCTAAVMPRLGYSGTGYLSGLSSLREMKLSLTTEIPATQHYDLTIVAGAEEAVQCQILINQEPVYTLDLEETENFVRVKIPGLFLQEGDCTLTIQPIEGAIDVDCVSLKNNETMYSETESEITTNPADSKATPAAKALLAFLAEQYGEKVITGQFVSDSSNREMDYIYETTGKYPMIRFADLQEYSRNGGNPNKATAVADSLAWAKDGGIVGLSWLWNAPTGNGTPFDKDTAFDLSVAAAATADIAQSTDAQLQTMVENGTISQSCYELVQDIDAVAEELQLLADADIPVIWRPLPDAGGGWYWWGAHGAENYRWLWNLLFHRMTEYHQLHNLLWVWNGQSDSYWADDTTYDIASLDLYVDQEESYGSRYEQFLALKNMTDGKILALSECSTVPDVNAMFRDNAVWSYFGLWYDTYLYDYTSKEALIDIYNSQGTLTRDDAPTM